MSLTTAVNQQLYADSPHLTYDGEVRRTDISVDVAKRNLKNALDEFESKLLGVNFDIPPLNHFLAFIRDSIELIEGAEDLFFLENIYAQFNSINGILIDSVSVDIGSAECVCEKLGELLSHSPEKAEQHLKRTNMELKYVKSGLFESRQNAIRFFLKSAIQRYFMELEIEEPALFQYVNYILGSIANKFGLYGEQKKDHSHFPNMSIHLAEIINIVMHEMPEQMIQADILSACVAKILGVACRASSEEREAEYETLLKQHPILNRIEHKFLEAVSSIDECSSSSIDAFRCAFSEAYPVKVDSTVTELYCSYSIGRNLKIQSYDGVNFFILEIRGNAKVITALSCRFISYLPIHCIQPANFQNILIQAVQQTTDLNEVLSLDFLSRKSITGGSRESHTLFRVLERKFSSHSCMKEELLKVLDSGKYEDKHLQLAVVLHSVEEFKTILPYLSLKKKLPILPRSRDCWPLEYIVQRKDLLVHAKEAVTEEELLCLYENAIAEKSWARVELLLTHLNIPLDKVIHDYPLLNYILAHCREVDVSFIPTQVFMDTSKKSTEIDKSIFSCLLFGRRFEVIEKLLTIESFKLTKLDLVSFDLWLQKAPVSVTLLFVQKIKSSSIERRLIKAYIGPQVHNYNSALHLVCRMGSIPLADALIRLGADLNNLDVDNETPLHIAVYGGHLNLVMYLCNQPKVSLVQLNSSLKLPLEALDPKLRAELYHVHIDKLRHQLSAPYPETRAGGTWFHYVLHKSVGPTYLKEFLEMGLHQGVQDHEGNGLLHVACEIGLPELVALLLSYRCDVLALNSLGDTPIHTAVKYGRVYSATFLLKTKSYRFKRGEQNTLLLKQHIRLLKESCQSSTGASQGAHPSSLIYKEIKQAFKAFSKDYSTLF